MDATKTIYCRFCAERNPENSILDMTLDCNLLEQIVEKLSNINFNYLDLSPENPLPKTICFTCYESLNGAINFLTKAKEAQSFLNQLVLRQRNIKSEKNIRATSSSEVDIKLENPNDHPKPNQSLVSDGESSGESITDENSVSDDYISASDKSWSSYPWVCVHCNAVFTHVKQLRDHAKEAHAVCYAFKCVECDDQQFNYEDFVQHVRVHRDYLGFHCQYCNLKLESYEHTKLHADKHIEHQNICSMCGELFPTNQLRRQHRATYKPKFNRIKLKRKLDDFKVYDCETEDNSWSGYTWVCQCKERFDDVNQLRTHTKEVHNKCFGMQCMDCSESVDSFKEFVDHVRKHRPYLKQYCEYCNHKYESEAECPQHLQLHFTGGGHGGHGGHAVCEGCGDTLPDRDSLNLHIVTYSPPAPRRVPFRRRDRPVTSADLTCPVCGKVTKSLSNLRSHRLVHTDRRRDHTCDTCGNTFYTRGALAAHCQLHAEPQAHVCEICTKSFLTITRLRKHVQTHSGSRPHQCAECGRRFRLKEQLRHHGITHTDLTPHTCAFCGKGFRFLNVLKTHLHQHTGARPYPCTRCSMDFANWSNCNKHMKRKHGITLAKNVLTTYGKLPLNPTTGLPRPLCEGSPVREWTEQIMGGSRGRGRGGSSRGEGEDPAPAPAPAPSTSSSTVCA